MLSPHQQTDTLHKNLVPNDTINARVTDRDVEVENLAEQIKAKGLLNPITVRKAKGGRFEIIAGNRRWAAIGLLIKSKDWPADLRVPITVREDDDAGALETSLMENVGQAPMHPVDQYERFADLERQDRSRADIAATFGMTQKDVDQRLALGNLASEIRAAWRDDKIAANSAQAFAVCPDKKLQVKVYRALLKQGSYALQPHNIRRTLLNDRPDLNDPRVRFVGLDRYKAAGGKVHENLFAEDGYLEDGALLNQLVGERLKEKCDELVADGWSFAKPSAEFGQVYLASREHPKPKYTPEQKARLKAIEKEIAAIERDEELDWSERDDKTEPLYDEKDEIEDAGKAIGFTKAQKAKTGCVVNVSTDGIEIEYGVYPLKKSRATAALPATETGSRKPSVDTGADPSALNGPLTHDITAAQTDAAARVVAEHPDLAVTLLISGLESYDGKCVDVNLGHTGRGRNKVTAGDFTKRLKKASGQTPDERMQVLARLVAASLTLVQNHPSSPKGGAKELVALLPGDEYLAAMRATFDVAGFFARAPGRIAIAALHEMGDTGIRSGRKDELAKLATDKAKEKGWLPEPLRHPEYALVGEAPKKPRARKAA